MKGSVTLSCLLVVCMALVGSSALAQREGPRTKASPALKTLMLENEMRLSAMESILNKLDAAKVVLEEDVKSLEKTLLDYIEGTDKVMAARGTETKEALSRDLQTFDDMVKSFEAKLRRIDVLHTTIAEKVQNGVCKLDKAWLNKMTQEQRTRHVKSLKPEGHRKMEQAHPELVSGP